MSSRKRKHGSGDDELSSSSILFIQAHEAEVVRGQQAIDAARSLESGDALVRWTSSGTTTFRAEDEVDDEQDIWVDRYDIRLLLNHLPTKQPHRSPSPSGWSDLPSDSEDTFFLSQDDIEDYRREKRRRLHEAQREERLKARMEQDGEEVWGGSDEEPDDTQNELMRRTAKQLASSDNPAQLEIRILANLGSDKRFAFLRGRWGRAWRRIQRTAKLEDDEEKEKAAKSTGLGLVAAYSDSEDEEGADSPTQAQEARRARLKEWSAKRREAREGQQLD